MSFSDYRTETPYTELDDGRGSTHNLVLGLVQPGSRVLEFGPATGYMSRALRERLGATVIGVELNAEAAHQAEPYLARVLIGDPEERALDPELGGERFDAVLFADALEPLREPAKLLQRVRQFVGEGDVVKPSIPNNAPASGPLSLL